MDLLLINSIARDKIIDFLKEYEEAEEDKYISTLFARFDGIDLEGGDFIPTEIYLLVDGGQVIGFFEIRRELNTYFLLVGGHAGYSIRRSKRKLGYGYEILRLGLRKMEELGFNRVLLVCSKTNIGSRKIILKAGGVLENTIDIGGIKRERYWIKLKDKNKTI